MGPPPPRHQRGTSSKKSLADDAPFHQPSRATSVESMEYQAYPHEKWTSNEKVWCFEALLDLRGHHTIGPAEKFRVVRRAWVERTFDKNDQAFRVDRVPRLDDVRRFSECVAEQIERQQFADGSMSGGASASVVVRSAVGRAAKRARKRKRIRYHSDDNKTHDANYLTFPITKDSIELYSARMIKAYNKALGIKSKSDRQKHRLLEVLATRNNSIERPATAPGGASWSEWYFEIVQ